MAPVPVANRDPATAAAVWQLRERHHFEWKLEDRDALVRRFCPSLVTLARHSPAVNQPEQSPPRRRFIHDLTQRSMPR
jgi:hypothetical protein